MSEVTVRKWWTQNSNPWGPYSRAVTFLPAMCLLVGALSLSWVFSKDLLLV
jgi:hypothetical protein